MEEIAKRVVKSLDTLAGSLDIRSNSQKHLPRDSSDPIFDYSAEIVPPILSDVAPPAIWKFALELQFSKYPNAHVAHSIKTAIEYAHMLNSEASDSSQITIVLAIAALESLLGPGTDEISQKMARRSAYLLAPSIANRPEWRDKFKKLYDRRSRFVHGSDFEVSIEDAVSAQVWFQEILRACLYFYQHRASTEGAISDLPTHIKLLKEMDDDFDSGRELPTGFKIREDLEELLWPERVPPLGI